MVSIVYSPLTEVKNEYTTNENGIHISPKIESVIFNCSRFCYVVRHNREQSNRILIRLESVLINICNQVFTADKI